MAGFATILIALLVASAAALVCRAYQGDIAAARARVVTGSQVVQTRCGPIEYASIGKGAPVLVVHGAGGGFDQGLQFGSTLATAGYRAIAMSRFGYLRTPLPQDASAVAQADAHACLLDALGIGKVAVIGASAGALSSIPCNSRCGMRNDAPRWFCWSRPLMCRDRRDNRRCGPAPPLDCCSTLRSGRISCYGPRRNSLRAS